MSGAEQDKPDQSEKKWFVFFVSRLVIVCFFALCTAALAGYLYIDVMRTSKGPHQETVLFDVPSGAGLFKIKHDLFRAGVISHPWQFHFAVMFSSEGFVPKAGEYEIPAKASLDQVMHILHSGRVFQHKLTIIEGWRSFDVMQALNDAEKMNSVILQPPDEGSVFPDTYFYTKGTDRRTLLAQMQAKMEITLAEIWAERAADLPLKNPEDLLKLASIIEKETGASGEKPLVSSVFMNRLRRKMRLQSDPTVSYGLSLNVSLKQTLSRSDLASPHKWNTYRIKGLPKTPIANPGYQALYAAAHPLKTDYLYFVADGEGGHNFAKTLDAHNRNVRKYRNIIRKKQKNPTQ